MDNNKAKCPYWGGEPGLNVAGQQLARHLHKELCKNTGAVNHNKTKYQHLYGAGLKRCRAAARPQQQEAPHYARNRKDAARSVRERS